MPLQTLDSAQVQGKNVLVRFDFNVPLKKGVITDTSRIDLSLPTIKFLLESGVNKLILMGHLGRPKGIKNIAFSMAPVADYLAEKLNQDIILTDSAVDNGVKELLTLKETKIVLLENLRFHPEEKKNDENFAAKLASYADIYVNDAFGTAHRKHASVHAINRYFTHKAYAGFLLEKEIQALDKVLNTPQKPFVAIIGGAKVSDKIITIEKLLVSVDKLIIGGAMAYPFLKAKGHQVGNSLCSDEDFKLAQRLVKIDKGNKISLPIDHIISESFGGSPQESLEQDIPNNTMGLDIGPGSIKKFAKLLSSAKTVLWNGPMGAFENPAYANGTFSLCEVLASLDQAFTLVGGGDSVSAARKSGFADKFSHISTGGGASLEYIEKGELVGIQALKFGV